MNEHSASYKNETNLDDLGAEYTMLGKIFKKLNKIEDGLVILKRQNEICRELDLWTQNAEYAVRTSEDPKEHHETLINWVPQFMLWHRRFYKSILSSGLVNEIEKRLGKTCVDKWKQRQKLINKDSVENIREEMRLVASYDQLVSGATVEFRGSEVPLKSLRRNLHGPNRNTRKSALTAYWSWFEENGAEIDDTFHALVALRCAIAKQNGWKSVTDLMYARYGRTQYTPTDIGHFRNALRELLAPILNDINERQRQSLSLDVPMPWDANVFSHQGNPRPIMKSGWLWQRAAELMPKVSSRFINFFGIEDKTISIQSGPSNSHQGMTILSNDAIALWLQTDGTMGDINGLVQLLTDALIQRTSQQNPYTTHISLDRRKILHKVFGALCLPHMEFLFPEDAERYRLAYALNELSGLNQTLMQDHFQQLIYSKPEANLFDRNAMWNRVESLYRPNLDWGELNHPARGAAWHAIESIFTQPFSEIGQAIAIPYGFQFMFFQEENPLRAQTRAEYICDETFGANPEASLAAVKCISPLKLDAIEHLFGDVKRKAFSSMV